MAWELCSLELSHSRVFVPRNIRSMELSGSSPEAHLARMVFRVRVRLGC